MPGLAWALAAGLAFAEPPRFEGRWEKQAPPGKTAVLGTGWAVRAPEAFTPVEAKGRLQWRRDVLRPPRKGEPSGGTQFEYITVAPESLPSGLLPFCEQLARDRGMPESTEKRLHGRRLLRYICPGGEWAATTGDSHSWRCLLQIDARSALEVNFWSTWIDVQDPARVERNRTAGLHAFERTCESLEPIAEGTGERPADIARTTLSDCQAQPDGFSARIQAIERRDRSFSVFRAGGREAHWSLVQVSSSAPVSVSQGERFTLASLDDLRPSDWVHVRKDCATGLATAVTIQRNSDGSVGGPALRLSALPPAHREAIEREMATKKETDPWNACFRLRLFQHCVIASR